MVARDAQAVVIVKSVPPDDPNFSSAYEWQYCARPEGPFISLSEQRAAVMRVGAPPDPPTSIEGLVVTGDYIAYVSRWVPRGENGSVAQVRVVNVMTHRVAHSGLVGGEGSPGSDAVIGPLLLGPNGTAAWLWTVYPSP